MTAGDRREGIQKLIERNLSVINKLEPHLGCAKCHKPLQSNRRCLLCQDRHMVSVKCQNNDHEGCKKDYKESDGEWPAFGCSCPCHKIP